MIENEFRHPGEENFDELKQEYLKSLEEDRELVRKSAESTIQQVELAEKALAAGNVEVVANMLKSIKEGVSVRKDAHIEVIDELEQAKIQGGEFLRPNLN